MLIFTSAFFLDSVFIILKISRSIISGKQHIDPLGYSSQQVRRVFYTLLSAAQIYLLLTSYSVCNI